jgi:peptidoglycan/LPS O-acetylase OafA/YrhL
MVWLSSRVKSFFNIDINSERNFGLDIVRAFAIFFVVLGHGNSLLPPPIKEYVSFFVLDGVSIFFVLSGFLIGVIFIKQLSVENLNISNIVKFWKRRWLRTLPNFYLILTLLTLIHLFINQDFKVQSVLSFYTFTQNLFYEHPSHFFLEAWSLSVEEWFYILMPLVVILSSVLFKFSYKKAILITIVLFIIAFTSVRFFKYLSNDFLNFKDWYYLFRMQVVTRLDSLIYGVLGAYIFNFHKGLWSKHKSILFIIGILILVIAKYLEHGANNFGTFYFSVFSFSFISIGTLFLFPYIMDVKPKNFKIVKVVTTISLISYSLYLVHLSIVRKIVIINIHWASLFDNAKLQIIFSYISYWGISMVLSLILYKYFELPILKYRDRKVYFC